MNREITEILSKSKGDTFVDCTVGMGGHSFCILKNLKHAEVIAVDVDQDSLEKASNNLKEFQGRVSFFCLNFLKLFESVSLENKRVAGILIDPGLSIYQIKDQGRGFSHSIEARLDMRKDQKTELTAYQVINKFPQKKLEDIFRHFGEVRSPQVLAKKIIERRLFENIDSTLKLTAIIEKLYGWQPKPGKVHPAAKVFQALRIYVNKELDGIEEFLLKIPGYLSQGAKLIFLSYHSIEDRLAKRVLKTLVQQQFAKIIKPFPMFPKADEIAMNLASRSAKLRVVELL